MMFKKLIPIVCLSFLLLAGCNVQTIEQGNDEITTQSTTNDSSESNSTIINNGENINQATSSKFDVSSFEEFPLVSVVDGDTIKIKYNGSSELVRFLLVDTPETNHPKLGKQPFGEEAKEFTKQLLENQDTVYLEFDVSYRDKYKRLLAYVYTKDGKSVQEELLKNGLARVAYIYEPNTKHVDWFESVQKTAQKQAVGIWSVENYVTDRGYDDSVFDGSKLDDNTEKTSKKDDYVNTTESACQIKGNINSKGEKIYHSPGQQYYDLTKPEVMFCSVKEAEAAGFRATLR